MVVRVVHPRTVTAPAAPVNEVPSVVVRVVHPRKVTVPAAPVNEILSAVVRNVPAAAVRARVVPVVVAREVTSGARLNNGPNTQQSSKNRCHY